MTRTELAVQLDEIRKMNKKLMYAVIYGADQGIIDRYWRDIKAKVTATDTTIEDD